VDGGWGGGGGGVGCWLWGGGVVEMGFGGGGGGRAHLLDRKKFSLVKQEIKSSPLWVSDRLDGGLAREYLWAVEGKEVRRGLCSVASRIAN